MLTMFYEWPTWVIVVGLLGVMLCSNEIGYRLGYRVHRSETELSRSVSNTLKGSVFGLVALLLAFSFSATTSRHDLRQRIVLDQANAIGTCYLRAGLLEFSAGRGFKVVLRNYVAICLQLIDADNINNDSPQQKEHRRAADHALNASRRSQSSEARECAQ